MGFPILTKLEKERFNEISKIGNGKYLDAHYSNDDEVVVLHDLEQRAEAQMALGKKYRIWDEHFFWLIIPALPLSRPLVVSAWLHLCLSHDLFLSRSRSSGCSRGLFQKHRTGWQTSIGSG